MSKDSERGKYRSPEGSSLWEYIAAMNCALMVFTVGCVAGWTSPTLGILMKPDSPIPLTPSDASTLSSMVALGHIMAPALTTVMADKLGRKNSLLAAGVPTITSWGLILASNRVMVLLVARFIGGLAFGLAVCLPAMYLGEIASAKLRGRIGVVCTTAMCAGALFMFIVVPYFSVNTTACICLSISIAAVIGVWFIPESPYYLAMIGKFELAEEALEKLRGKTDVTEELEIIKLTISEKTKSGEGEIHRGSSAFRQIFKVPGNRKALWINILFMGILEFGSFVILMVYAHVIFDRLNAGISANVCTIMMVSLQLIFNILTTFVIDKLGRRPLICVSGIISGACVLVVGIYFYLIEYTKTDVTPYGMFAICALFVNFISLNIGLVPMQQVIQSETLATEVKGMATCVVQISGGVMATISVKYYLMIAETWEFGHCVPFFGFAVVTWTCTAIILMLLPETKGKTLLDIQRDLNA